MGDGGGVLKTTSSESIYPKRTCIPTSPGAVLYTVDPGRQVCHRFYWGSSLMPHDSDSLSHGSQEQEGPLVT